MNKQILPLAGAATSTLPSAHVKAYDGNSFSDILDEQHGQQRADSTAEPVIFLGEITSENRTVSELLIQHDQLKQSTWELLSSPQNKDKEYTKLQPGTQVYFNPNDTCLSWPDQAGDTHRALAQDTPRKHPVTQRHVPGSVLPTVSTTAIELGVVTREIPTVSHLLKAHPEFSAETWRILSSQVNNEKDFSQIPVGATVRISSTSHEISWLKQNQARSAVVNSVTPFQFHDTESLEKVSAEKLQVEARASVTPEDLVFLGKIDSTNPTVSHLLIQHPELKDQTWNLLSNSLNSSKPFQKIDVGTEVYFNPSSQEIHWQQAHNNPPIVAQENSTAPIKLTEIIAAPSVQSPALDLTEAVQPFLGASYKDINCYELLVEGLRRMDIPYRGKNGLFSKLTRMAQDNGMPINAYLNGEGIVKAAGSLVLSKNYSSVGNWQKESASFYSEMEPLLNKGQILSFSTESRGHTGIVSRQNNHWTFINSGRLDNVMTLTNVSKGVGEESLQEEIGNWFKLAHANRESLRVTLGKLRPEKAIAVYNQQDELSRRI